MAGLVSSFLHGSNLVIRIGSSNIAFAQGISMSDDIGHVPIGGMGSYGYSSLEPLQYSARGSMSILRYSNATLKDRQASSKPGRVANYEDPTAAAATPPNDRDGNSMLHRTHLNPRKLILSRTFDIEIFERINTGNTVTSDLTPTFILKDCRLTSYSMTFTPNQAISENVGFICIQIVDVAGGQAVS